MAWMMLLPGQSVVVAGRDDGLKNGRLWRMLSTGFADEIRRRLCVPARGDVVVDVVDGLFRPPSTRSSSDWSGVVAHL